MRAAILAVLTALPVNAGEAPQRVVSLNLCADQIVLRLLPRIRIASVTWLAQEDHSSTVAALAQGIPTNQGLAEQVIGLDPDLVLAGRYTARGAVDFLARQNRSIFELGVPESFAGARTQIVDIAAAVGAPERGAALVAEMDAKLAAQAEMSPKEKPRAMMLGPNGFATSYGPLVDEMMERAGLVNLASSLGADGRTNIPLESAIMGDIDILVVDAGERSGPALAQEVLAHPAVRALGREVEVVALPSNLWTCAGPQLADAVALLAAARRTWQSEPR